MTHPLPIAATLRILLLDGCVISFSAHRPRYPTCERPRPPPWLRALERADTARATLRTRVGRTRGSHPGFLSAPSTAERSSPTDPDRNTPCRRSMPALPA